MTAGGEAESSARSHWLGFALTVYLRCASLLVAFIAVSVSIAVVSRRVLDQPMPWTIEVTEHLLLFVVFLGVAHVSRDNAHVKMELLAEFSSERATRVLDLLADLLSMLTAGALLVASVWITYNSYQRGVPTTGILAFPRWIGMVCIPLGCVLLTLEHGRRFILRLRGRDPEIASKTAAGP